MRAPNIIGMNFQPTGPGWTEGSKFGREVFCQDEASWRPDEFKQNARVARALNFWLKIGISTDRWPTATKVEASGIDPEGGSAMIRTEVLVPNDPSWVWLKLEDGSPAILHKGHHLLLPNIDLSRSRWEELADYLFDEYILKPSGDSLSLAQFLRHDWWQDALWGVEGLSEDQIERSLAFRIIMLVRWAERMAEITGIEDFPIYVNGGSVSNMGLDVPCIKRRMLEGITYGGTRGQVAEGVKMWLDAGKEIEDLGSSIEHTYNQDLVQVRGMFNKASTDDFRSARASMLRTLAMGSPNIGMSAGMGHEGIFLYDEMGVDLGEMTQPPFQTENGIFCSTWKNGIVLYYDGDKEATFDVLERGTYYRFQGGQDPEWNNGARVISVTFPPAIRSPYNTSRHIGEGIILVDKPTTSVCDLVAGIDHFRSSPGVDPMWFEGEWNKTSFEHNLNYIKAFPDNPLRSYQCWTTMPIYRNDITWGIGTPIYGHVGYNPQYLNVGSSGAEFKVGVAGLYDVCEWLPALGRWHVLRTDRCIPGQVVKVLGFNGQAYALRFRGKEATDYVISTAEVLENGTPIIFGRDPYFGIHFNGYISYFVLQVKTHKGWVTVPKLETLYGFQSPRGERYSFACTFPKKKDDRITYATVRVFAKKGQIGEEMTVAFI